jgi:hypothetical protein
MYERTWIWHARQVWSVNLNGFLANIPSKKTAGLPKRKGRLIPHVSDEAISEELVSIYLLLKSWLLLERSALEA